MADERIKVTLDYINDIDWADWENMPVKVREFIPLEDMLELVRGVASSCFSAETGEYMPEIKDFAFRTYVVELFTNIDLPEDLSESYEILYNTPLFGYVESNIDESGQITPIMEAIDQRIGYTARQNVETVNSRLNNVVSELENIERDFSNIFGGIDGDTMNNIANAISDGTFDTDKLVKSIMKQQTSEDK